MKKVLVVGALLACLGLAACGSDTSLSQGVTTPAQFGTIKPASPGFGLPPVPEKNGMADYKTK